MSYMDINDIIQLTRLAPITDIIMTYLTFPKYKLILAYDNDDNIIDNDNIELSEISYNCIDINDDKNHYSNNNKHNYIFYYNNIKHHLYLKINKSLKLAKKYYSNTMCPSIYMIQYSVENNTCYTLVYELDTNYLPNIPNKYKTKKKCIHAFNRLNINHKHIPKKYLTQEICNRMAKVNPSLMLKEIPQRFITSKMTSNVVCVDGMLFNKNSTKLSNYIFHSG
jgi:hypothetical protein